MQHKEKYDLLDILCVTFFVFWSYYRKQRKLQIRPINRYFLAKNVLARIVLNLVSDLQWPDSQGKNGQNVFWIWILVKQNEKIFYGLCYGVFPVHLYC